RVGDERVDALLRRRALGAALVLPDDVDLLAGVAAELLLGELARGLGLRARGVVVGAVLAREGAADSDDHHHRRKPREDRAAAVAVGDLGKACEEVGHGLVSDRGSAVNVAPSRRGVVTVASQWSDRGGSRKSSAPIARAAASQGGGRTEM